MSCRALVNHSRPSKRCGGEAKLLSGAGYWGAIERHHEFTQDNEHDDTWHVDWERAGDKAIETIDYF
jgi:hypothetical protein